MGRGSESHPAQIPLIRGSAEHDFVSQHDRAPFFIPDVIAGVSRVYAPSVAQLSMKSARSARLIPEAIVILRSVPVR